MLGIKCMYVSINNLIKVLIKIYIIPLECQDKEFGHQSNFSVSSINFNIH